MKYNFKTLSAFIDEHFTQIHLLLKKTIIYLI